MDLEAAVEGEPVALITHFIKEFKASEAYCGVL